MSDKHALLSASGSARWLECTMSPSMESKFENTTSSYAREGTVAHALGELYARLYTGQLDKKAFNKEKKALISKGDGKEFYNQEMDEHAEAYGRLIERKLTALREDCPDAFAELEVRVDFSEWVPEGFGTCDCAIVADDLLEIVDLKYGKGHAVEAEGNTQMRLYALGALNAYGSLYDIKAVKMSIFQPRLFGQAASDTITVTELLQWADEYVRPRARKAFDGNGEFSPGDATCQFCRAKEQCKARYDYNLSLFDEREDPDLITPDEAGAVLERASDIKKWLSDLESLVLRTLMNGETVYGWKMVEGRSNRKYTDEAEVAKALIAAGVDEDLIYERSLIGISALEKGLGKKKVAELLKDLIVKPEGKPTLAPISDKREAIKPKEKLLKEFDD